MKQCLLFADLDQESLRYVHCIPRMGDTRLSSVDVKCAKANCVATRVKTDESD